MKTWLLLDVSNLCHRAFYVMGDLSYEDRPTGVLFGLLKDIVFLQDKFRTSDIVFCFDYGDSFRLNVYPTYKQARRTKREQADKEERKSRRTLQRQIRELRDKILPKIGFKNVLYQEGFEADDVIASVCHTLEEGEEAIVVSSDSDLLQLLSHRVRVYTPNKGGVLVTLQSFFQRYNISPVYWSKVKAIAGCPTDSIEGVKGVGESTAVKYLKGELNKQTKTYQAISNFNWMENLSLTHLPYTGCPKFTLMEDRIQLGVWNSVVELLGMESLKNKLPIRRR